MLHLSNELCELFLRQCRGDSIIHIVLSITVIFIIIPGNKYSLFVI